MPVNFWSSKKSYGKSTGQDPGDRRDSILEQQLEEIFIETCRGSGDFFEKLDEENTKMCIGSVEKKYLYVWASTDDKGANSRFVRLVDLDWMAVREEIKKNNMKGEQLQLDLKETHEPCQKCTEVRKGEGKIYEEEKRLEMEKMIEKVEKEAAFIRKMSFLELYKTFFKKYLILDRNGKTCRKKLSDLWLNWRDLPEARSICNKEYSSGVRGLSHFINELFGDRVVYGKNTTGSFYSGMRFKTKEEMAQ